MATYYVDYVNGLDANNGLGPDASHATNKPWKTLAKLLGAAGMASGDTAYLSPAGPFRETVTVAMTSATAETKVIGDPANAQGFKTSGGVAVAPGDVIWTAYTTNDTTAPAAACSLTFSGRDFLTFQNIFFVGGNATNSCADATTSVSTDIKFQDCVFMPHLLNRAIFYASAAGTAANWTVDRCRFVGAFGGTAQGIIQFQIARHTADYDLNFVISNCLTIGQYNAIRTASSGAGAGFGGGVVVKYCTLWGGVESISITDASMFSATFPMVVTGCVIKAGSTGLNANNTNQITESYNIISATTARTNVTAGTGSQANTYAPLIEMGQAYTMGRQTRPFGEPVKGSPLLAFSSAASPPAYDGLDRPRPAGGLSALPAAGYLERGNTFARETTTVRTGSNALSITGPGYQDFLVPVDATSTTVTVYLRQDTTYAGTQPKLQVLANPEIGVSAAEDTLGAADDTWEQQSLNFTPTAKGVVTIRLLSTDTNGAGKVFADDFAVT